MFFKIKNMQLVHLDQVCTIEKNLNAPNYWTRQAFIDELNKDNSAYWVSESKDLVFGYIGMNIIGEEGFITNVAVSADWQRQKIGDSLLKHLILKAREWKIKNLSLEVRISNMRARNLYTKYGFFVAGERKNYYQDNKETALILWTPSIQEEDYLNYL